MRIAGIAVMIAAVLLPAGAIAQEVREAQDNKEDSTMSEAGKIAARPVHDVGLANKKVPPVLLDAEDAPYSTRGTGSCAQISGRLRDLDKVLGPDFDVPSEDKGTRAGQIAKIAGETAVDTISPFRGRVREVSGAAAAQRRMQAATYAGLARRGFLRGMAKAKGCKV